MGSAAGEKMKKMFGDVQELFGDVGEFVAGYPCALESGILRQGRMFITNKFVCFYCSHFGAEKKIRIPYKQIRTITKENTAMVIPNAIEIKTLKTSYMFRSFLSRDECFNLINSVLKNWKIREGQNIAEIAAEEEELGALIDNQANVSTPAGNKSAGGAAIERTASAASIGGNSVGIEKKNSKGNVEKGISKVPETARPPPIPVVPISRPPPKPEIKYHTVLVQANSLEITHNVAGKKGIDYVITVSRGAHNHTIECEYETFKELYDEVMESNADVLQVPFPLPLKEKHFGQNKLNPVQIEDRLGKLNVVRLLVVVYF